MMLPDVRPEMLDPQFWIERLLTPKGSQAWSAEACNTAVRANSQALANISNLAEQMLRGEEPVTSLWVVPEVAPRELYDQQGRSIDAEAWGRIRQNAQVAPVVEHLGFTVRRADVRSWPTATAAYRNPADREFDQLQETAIHTFEPLVVLGQSQDHGWYLVQTETYQGWMRQTDVALASAEHFRRWSAPDQFLVTTGSGVTTAANPYDHTVSQKPIEFGGTIPLANPTRLTHSGGQSRIGHHVVEWPVRTDQGWLDVRSGLVKESLAVQVGYGPFSRQTLLQCGFALLYDRYGWGDSFGTHDCSSFVMDAYRTMGVRLPRNANTQERCAPYGVNFEPAAVGSARERALAQLQGGDLLYMPGHVLMYLGEEGAHHYAIHAFVGYAKRTGTSLEVQLVNQVMVSTLDVLTRQGTPYRDVLTRANSLFGPIAVDR